MWKGALTFLETAVDLLVLQQLLAVVLKRLISRVRHDEKPPLIGDAGNGHGRLGGGRGGAREESLPGGVDSWNTPPLPVGSTSDLCVSFHPGRGSARKKASCHTVPFRPGWVKQDAITLIVPGED